MRTIESTATVTTEGTLIVPAPDLRPGSYHVVVVIETAPVATDAPAPPANDAWERLNQFRDELATLSPASPTLAEQLDTDRRERQALIEGSGHVHP